MLKKLTKLAIAQVSTDAGYIRNNTNKIIKYIKRANSDGAKIIVFPELTIPGYMSLDLMLNSKYIEQNIISLSEIKKYTQNLMVIVGFIDREKSNLGPDGKQIRYNSAAIIYKKKILAIQDKTLLPDYDVFFENRYFSQGRGRKLIEYEGIKLGVEICEDLWDENYPIKVSEDLVRMGADILINISGSPFYLGKRFDREKLIKKVSKRYKVPFIYVNTVGVQDGYDGELVFDGQSMVFNNKGNLVNLGRQFEEELFYVNLENLIKKGEEDLKLPEYSLAVELYKALTLAIKDYFRRTNFSQAFIGLSGGIDSAVVCALAVDALGNKNVTGLYMPSLFTSKQSLEEVKKLTNNLQVELKVIPIINVYKKFLLTLRKQFKNLPFDITEENMQARIRGMILMAHANKFRGLVISTANKTETALGYSTLYGDMCGAIAPIADVSKLNVYSLANFINEKGGREIIPKTTLKRVPTAELRENQTDEESLGGSYKLISPLVDKIIEEEKSFIDLAEEYPKGLINKIIDLINKSEYKRRQAAPAVKVTKKAFGLGRRIPIVHNFRN